MAILLVATALALLVIYAGIKLLIQVKKEMLGNLYKCAAWTFVAAGFLLLACIGVCGIAKCYKFGMKMHHGRMNQGSEDHMRMKHHKMHGMMMNWNEHDGMHSECMSQMNCCRMENSCGMTNGYGAEGCCPKSMMMSCSQAKADSMKRKK